MNQGSGAMAVDEVMAALQPLEAAAHALIEAMYVLNRRNFVRLCHDMHFQSRDGH